MTATGHDGDVLGHIGIDVPDLERASRSYGGRSPTTTGTDRP